MTEQISGNIFKVTTIFFYMIYIHSCILADLMSVTCSSINVLTLVHTVAIHPSTFYYGRVFVKFCFSNTSITSGMGSTVIALTGFLVPSDLGCFCGASNQERKSALRSYPVKALSCDSYSSCTMFIADF